MNRLAWVVFGGMTVTAWGVTGALGGCKAAPAPTAPADDGTSGGTLGDTGTSGGKATSGGTTSGGTSGGTTSGGTSGTIPDAGPPDTGPPPVVSNPKKISCGATGECTTGTQECCWPLNDAGGGVCQPVDGCPGDPDGDNFDVKCDEKADCPGGGGNGALCCFGFGQTLCLDDCAEQDVGQGIQICKTNGECLNDAGCAPRTCNAGGTIIKVRMCGTTPECL